MGWHTRGMPAGAQKVCSPGGAKGFFSLATKGFIFFWHEPKRQCVGCSRRRQKALGRVVTCPEGWMALKRKPRNMALFALWCIGLICKIEAGLRQVSVGK